MFLHNNRRTSAFTKYHNIRYDITESCISNNICSCVSPGKEFVFVLENQVIFILNMQATTLFIDVDRLKYKVLKTF